jgi:5-methylcytosine-specific restriction enzyme subunit McrC
VTQPARIIIKVIGYPKVDRELREHYEILGRKVSICTIDLDAPWQSIDQEIRALMK